MWYMGTGENFWSTSKCIICYQKVRTKSRSVSVHSDLNYDASCSHRRGLGDKPKNDIFLLVTTRLIVHSGQSQFFPNCDGEFSRDSG